MGIFFSDLQEENQDLRNEIVELNKEIKKLHSIIKEKEILLNSNKALKNANDKGRHRIFENIQQICTELKKIVKISGSKDVKEKLNELIDNINIIIE